MRLLLDTNVLFPLLVGSIQPARFEGRKLETFTLEDFKTVANWAVEFREHVSLPNILSETSNLLGDAKQQFVPGGLAALAAYVNKVDEVYVPSKRAVSGKAFHRLGLTDTAIHDLTLEMRDVCVISMDYRLNGFLAKSGIECRNPLHYRSL